MTNKNFRQFQDKNILSFLNKNKRLSYAGKQWLIQSLDPFHDSVITKTGLPDTENSKSIVVCTSKEFTISAPPGLSSGTWDCNIFTLNELGAINVSSTNIDTSYSITNVGTSTNNILFSTLNYLSFPTGTNPINFSGNTSILNTNCSYSSLQPDNIDSNSRLVGMGFEVHNSTAEMYLQGEVFCYRQPQEIQAIAGYGQPYPAGQTNTASQVILVIGDSGYVSRLPPLTLSQVEQYPDTKSWNAKEGSYSVATMDPTINPFCERRNGCRIFSSFAEYNSSSSNNSLISTSYSTNTIGITAGSTTTTTRSSGWTKPTPIDTVGAYYTGLSLQTSLVVTVKFFVEFVPNFNDTTLVNLAKPSPCYDPVALQLYTYARCAMPPGVPVNQNNLGEWFSKVVHWMGDHAETIGSVAGTLIPEAALAGKITAIVAQQMKGLINHANSSIKQVKNTVKKEVKKDVKRLK